ncbi:MAG: chloride channel protein [Candidatus Woesearchaeota archaeon]|jgi:H+/Cl- antiporter ClcA
MSRLSNNKFSEQTVLFISIVKWVLIATLVGVIVGFTTAGFVKLLDLSIANASKYWYWLFTIPLSLFITTIIRKYVFPKDDIETTNQVIGNIHHSKSISWKSGLKAFFLPIITIAGGGSAGKEAPCADVGASAGSILSKWFKFNDSDRRKIMICGVSAGFASVFGTPIAGAIFGVEVLFVGGLLYEVLLPSFIAGIVAYQVAASLGVVSFTHYINFTPVFNHSFLLLVVAAGIFFGLISFLTVETFKRIQQVSNSIKLNESIKALAAGTVIAIIIYIFSADYMGLGLNTIDFVLAGGVIVWYAFIIKLIVTAITLNFGGSGGTVTPTFFIGATAGSLFAVIFHADPATFAAIGFVAVLAGVANTPIAASILAIEVFGPQVAPYAAVVCVISFLMTGHRSLYSNQVLSIQKSSSLKAIQGQKLGETKTKIIVRKKGVLKYALRVRKRRKKLEKKYEDLLKKSRTKLTAAGLIKGSNEKHPKIDEDNKERKFSQKLIKK